jgi:hypothetical protein
LKVWIIAGLVLGKLALADQLPNLGLPQFLFEKPKCAVNSEAVSFGLTYVSGLPNRERTVGLNFLADTQARQFFLYDTLHDDTKFRLDICVDSFQNQVNLKRVVIFNAESRKVYAIDYKEELSETITSFQDTADGSLSIYKAQIPVSRLRIFGLKDLVFDANYQTFSLIVSVPDFFLKYTIRYGNPLVTTKIITEDFVFLYEGDYAIKDHQSELSNEPITNQLLGGKLEIVNENYLINRKCPQGGNFVYEDNFSIEGYEIFSSVCSGGKLNGTTFYYLAELKIKKDTEVMVESRDPLIIAKYYKLINKHHNECDQRKIKLSESMEYFSNGIISALFKNGAWIKIEKKENSIISSFNCPIVPERFTSDFGPAVTE